MKAARPIKIRQVRWMTSHLRPVAMPSVQCPRVRIYGSDEIITQAMGINHCLPCACACEIRLDMQKLTGEVLCNAAA